MGATCAKGSKTTDPDKTPYGANAPPKGRGSKGESGRRRNQGSREAAADQGSGGAEGGGGARPGDPVSLGTGKEGHATAEHGGGSRTGSQAVKEREQPLKLASPSTFPKKRSIDSGDSSQSPNAAKTTQETSMKLPEPSSASVNPDLHESIDKHSGRVALEISKPTVNGEKENLSLKKDDLFDPANSKAPYARESDQKTSDVRISAPLIESKNKESEKKPGEMFGSKTEASSVRASASPALVGFSAVQTSDVRFSVKPTETAPCNSPEKLANLPTTGIKAGNDAISNKGDLIEKSHAAAGLSVVCDATSNMKQTSSDKPDKKSTEATPVSSIKGSESYTSAGKIEKKGKLTIPEKSVHSTNVTAEIKPSKLAESTPSNFANGVKSYATDATDNAKYPGASDKTVPTEVHPRTSFVSSEKPSAISGTSISDKENIVPKIISSRLSDPRVPPSTTTHDERSRPLSSTSPVSPSPKSSSSASVVTSPFIPPTTPPKSEPVSPLSKVEQPVESVISGAGLSSSAIPAISSSESNRKSANFPPAVSSPEPQAGKVSEKLADVITLEATGGAKKPAEAAQEIVADNSSTGVIAKEEPQPLIQNGEKQESKRVSKLPTSRLPSSSSTSPPVVASSPTSVPSLSPISPPGSSTASPHQKLLIAPSLQHEERISREELADVITPLLMDLSEENKVILESNTLCPNTRTKLLQAVEKWLSGKDRENPTRVLAIHGKPAIGKTCFSAEVCRKFSAELAACHFFQHLPMFPEQNVAATMLLSLAHQLCRVFPGYFQALPRPSKLKEVINNGDVSEMFDALVAHPLQNKTIQTNPDKHFIIVIDDLNECDLSQRDQLMQLVNGFNERTPDWLYLLVTLNDDEEQLVSQLNKAQMIEVKGTSEAMSTDLKRYFKEPMSPFIDRISLDGAQAQLMQNSQGSFLCAYLLRKRLESLPPGTKLALRDVAMFPSGIGDLYKETFQRLYDYLSKKFSSREAPGVYGSVVGVLVVARESIDKSALSHIHSELDVDETLSQFSACLVIKDNTFVGFHHRHTANWLQAAGQAPPKLMPNITDARKKMADLCVKWLEPIVGTSKNCVVSAGLRNYALRHALTHLTDVPNEQDGIATILCSLCYVEEKLKLPRVNFNTLRKDFTHSHYQPNTGGGGAAKLISLASYMKKYPHLVEQIQAVQEFVLRKGDKLAARPEFTLHVAANYPTNQRIQQNARIDVAEKPWLEDMTVVADTPAIVTRSFDGTICDVDGSPDHKSLVVLCVGKDSSAVLHVLNATSGDNAMEPIKLKNASESGGNCVKVLSDNANVFVGCLKSYVNMKTGKSVPSGLDVDGVPVKERYTVECCDVTANLLCCGVTTLPWGGRSLHVIVFDLKTKKCSKALEVLKFKFGGSPHFGVKACALSTDGSLLCACVKQTNKCELHVTIWSTATWEVVKSTDVDNDALTKCFFIGNEHLLLTGSVRTRDLAQGRVTKSYLWSFQEKTSKVELLNEAECCSVACSTGAQLTTAQWFKHHGHVTISKWKKFSAGSQSPDDLTRLHGIDDASDVIAFDKTLVLIANNSAKFYKHSDLEKIPGVVQNDDVFPVSDVEVLGVSFIPRSDEPVVTYQGLQGSTRNLISTCSLNLKGDGLLVSKRLFSNIKPSTPNADSTFSRRRFHDSFSEICCTSPDGSLAILHNGNEITVSEVNGGKTKVLLPPDKVEALSDKDSLICAVSPKDFIVAVVYSALPDHIFLHDIKAKPGAQPMKIKAKETNSQPLKLDDVSFLPSTGDVIACSERSLFVWNHKTGELLSKEDNVGIAYMKSSPASDRFVLSHRSADVTKALVLRNAANNINCPLKFAAETKWLSDLGESSVGFSDDGTVVIGVCNRGGVSRVWNAANGEVLVDLSLRMSGDVEVVGMLTNTHAVFADKTWLIVCDIGTDDIVAALPLDDIPARHAEITHQNSKTEMARLRVSPRGNFVVGAARDGSLRMFQSQNITGVKRKTTLQRMKAK